jgi:hypothetical protein
MRQLVINGPHRYPGASIVETEDGKQIYLVSSIAIGPYKRFYTLDRIKCRRRRESLSPISFSLLKMRLRWPSVQVWQQERRLSTKRFIDIFEMATLSF